MKKTLFSSVLIFIFLAVAGQEGKKLVILHTNDLHSHLNGWAPESEYSPLVVNNDKTTGGFARIAAILRSEKARNPEGTLTIDAGDFLMGTLFQSLESKTGFQLCLMKKMGYDLVCLGNHEFDAGPENIAGTIDQARKMGEIPQLLLGNVVFDPASRNDDSFEKLFSDGALVRKTSITREGVKIGFFSLLGKVATGDAPMAKPLTFSDQVSTSRKLVKELQDEGCQLIICVSHSGVEKKTDGTWGGEDVDLARKVKGIDLIISGHTHTRLDNPVFSKGVPIVQTGEYGQYVGRLALTWSGGKLKVDSYRLIPVNDSIEGDSETDKLIKEQQVRVTEEILNPLGLSYSEAVGESGFLLECNEQGDFKSSNLGPMVADAIRYSVNKHSSEGTDIAMVAVGVIRDRIVPGIMTPADVFRVMALGSGNDKVPGYPLSRLYVKGRDLKNVLEVLQVAYKSAPSNYCFYSGLKVEFNPSKGLLKKIRKIEITGKDGNSENIDFSKHNKKLYSITANSYMLKFIGIIKKKSFGLINVVPRDAAGSPITDMSSAVIDFDPKAPGIQEGKEWLALLEFIRSMKDQNNNGISDVDLKYSLPVTTFFPVR
jgi:5'-nucleotidase